MPESGQADESREESQRGSAIGEMHARRERMADGRRYIIYFTFGEEGSEHVKRQEAPENV